MIYDLIIGFYICGFLVKFFQIVRAVMVIYQNNCQIEGSKIFFWSNAFISCLLWPYSLINNILYAYEKRRK
jgi:hypothetical protein